MAAFAVFFFFMPPRSCRSLSPEVQGFFPSFLLTFWSDNASTLPDGRPLWPPFAPFDFPFSRPSFCFFLPPLSPPPRQSSLSPSFSSLDGRAPLQASCVFRNGPLFLISHFSPSSFSHSVANFFHKSSLPCVPIFQVPKTLHDFSVLGARFVTSFSFIYFSFNSFSCNFLSLFAVSFSPTFVWSSKRSNLFLNQCFSWSPLFLPFH